MFFALCQCELFLPQGRSLKGKRSVVKSIKERLRSRFHASAAEVGHQDLHQRARIGIALIGTSPSALEDALGAMRRLVEDESRCTITAWETRVEPFEGAPRAPVDESLPLGTEATSPSSKIPGKANEPAGRWNDVDDDDELFGSVWTKE